MSDRAEFEIIEKGMKEHLEMAGTMNGGLIAKETNYKRYGKDFYREIGKKGGMTIHQRNENGKALKGFALNPERAKLAGQKGGTISKRGKAKK